MTNPGSSPEPTTSGPGGSRGPRISPGSSSSSPNQNKQQPKPAAKQLHQTKQQAKQLDYQSQALSSIVNNPNRLSSNPLVRSEVSLNDVVKGVSSKKG